MWFLAGVFVGGISGIFWLALRVAKKQREWAARI